MDPNEAYKNALLNIETSNKFTSSDSSLFNNETILSHNQTENIPASSNHILNLPNPIEALHQNTLHALENQIPLFSSPYSIPTVVALESKLAEFSLLAKFVQGPVDFRQVMGKLKAEWKNLKGQFLCDDMGNEWLIIKFANKEDRNQVWENRPYHVQGQLLALYQWHESFDPSIHDTTSVDLWLRIPGIPHQLLTPNAIELILRENGVGRLIRLDPASNIRNKLKFVRCCVNVDLTKPLICLVNILKANGSLLSLRVWYEDFSDGCGCCGGVDHTYDDCPINKPQPRKFQVILEEKPYHDILLNSNKNLPVSPTGHPNSSSPILKSPNPEMNNCPTTLPSSNPDLASTSNPITKPVICIPNLLPNSCSMQMINPDLLRQLLALHNSNPNIPHPLENIAYPIERPISPKNKNCNTLPQSGDSSIGAVIAQQLTPSADTTDHNNEEPNNTTKTDSSIVRKMENVDIKSAGQSSTDSDPVKRKEEQDTKDISSPSTKRPRKKKN